MTTPAQKATEIVKEYHKIVVGSLDQDIINKFKSLAIEYKGSKWVAMWKFARRQRAKECAVICVDEILKIEKLFSTNLDCKMNRYSLTSSAEFWEEVKQKIEEL